MPEQKNSYDCGVYVCRYAYNMYLMRNRSFKKADIDSKFKYISNSAVFKFTEQDIIRIRLELNKLVERMTIVYNPILDNNKRFCTVPKINI